MTILNSKETNTKNNSSNEYCTIYENIKSIKQIDVYLNKEIGRAENYTNLLNLLRTSDENTTINLYINNGGGYIYSALQIINAIKTAKCLVKTIIDGAAHSASSLIFLIGDVYEVFPNSMMLCHYYSTIEMGKASDIENSIDFNKLYYKNIYREIYEGFLTKDEINRVFKGEDIWLNHTQIMKRLKKRSVYFKKQEKEEKSKKEKRIITKHKKTNK